jgi:hypothetical protein
MTVAIFFLLCGILAAEWAVIGVRPAAFVGIACFAAAALVLGVERRHEAHRL